MLEGTTGLIAFLVVLVLAVVFLVLWLTKKGGDSGDAAAELRQAQNQIKLLKGDAMQASKEHTATVERLNKELETLRAVAGGRVPPEMEQYRQRADTAERQLADLRTRNEQLTKELDELQAAENLDKTVIAPSTEAIHTRVSELERMLEAAKAEVAAVAERMGAEKAAAISALEQRHEIAMERLRHSAGLGAAAVASAVSAAAEIVPKASSADPRAMAYFEITSGEHSGQKIYLSFASGSLGRSDDCTYTLDEDRSSRHHADLVYEGGQFAIRDNGSTNGTFVNDTAVSHKVLEFGDVVGIGDTKLRFSCAGADAGDDRDEAISAFESMLKAAPNFAPAQAALANLRS